MQDEYGKWWHASTMRISVNQNFERRAGIWRADLTETGNCSVIGIT